ncbi:hypothetical protein HF086_003874 [Spodoptera exigua]|uniref:HECT-type E3 ubiquitin transferase n=1 Tax=Spodoptera exigua TaxID=7107 RepID=A0A922SLT4_SPOEX|nr:hypothetical protein HF086_003874 [Spodoptera exigua]
MYSFEGDFRRKPQQNLAGASAQRKTDRDTLILQSQQQRQKREEHRKRLNSTIKIQAYVRSYLTRKHYKQYERDQFDSIFPRINPDDQQMMCALVAKILFFYDEQQDYSRLVAVSQLLLKQWKKVYQICGACVQIRRLLVLHLHLLKENSEVPLAVPLRMFEVFTSTNSAETSINCDEALSIVGNTFLYLVKRGYFQDLCKLLCQKTPPLYGPSPNPPTPLSGALLDLIQRPLTLISRVNIPHYDDSIMTEFASAFLCNPYPEPVEMYVLPVLAQDQNKKFPFLSLIRALQEDSKFSSQVLHNNSWLLHSVLTLEPPDFVNVVRNLDNTRLPNNPIVLDYFKIIAKLTVNVCNKQISYEFEDSLYSQETVAEKDDDSDSEQEPNPTSVREQMLLTRCIELLNEPERCIMTTCSQITEADLSEDFLDSLLLYTLAFKPMFLRGLWVWVSGMSQTSQYGAPATPLLGALCRGLAHDARALSLHLGVAVPSTDVGRGGRVHAFEFHELGALCRTLRAVCLGLVELAYPESRPTVAGPYRDAVNNDHIHISGKNQTPAWSHLFKAMYENLLVELPLAEFFLGKLCGAGEADVHALASLDPALHRGLLLLRAHARRDVPDLGLDFTLLTDELGEQRIEELKPGGANIPVTAENRIEYIHLVADYKLNKQIRSQCTAFKRGLVSVVSAEWLRMFSCRELQLLISGAEVPIDIDDLRRHTHYAGGFSAQHPTVQCFWRVLATFSDDQRRQLLKFVTSCSRPPLLGFKDLQPPFCIQSAGASDRLPSSSTCMNLLKLPEFHTDEQLTEKLLYAIQAGAGFELS